MRCVSITVHNHSVEAGERQWIPLNVASDADGSEITVQACIVHGGDGDTLWVQGALHGSEQVGAIALRDYLLDIDPEEVDGTIIGVPVANPPAFASKQRLTSVDGRDANRSFPGSSSGYFSELLANVLFETAVEHADYFVDLHNGGNEYHVPGFVIYSKTDDAVEEDSVAMCRASNLPYAVGVDKEFGGSMATEIVDRDIPAVVVEAGGKSHVSDKYYEKNYHAIENIAKDVGVVAGDSVNNVDLSLHDGQTWLHASSGGFFERIASSNTEVSEGEEVAKTTNIKGEVVETFTAPFDGIVLCMRSYPVARPGDWAVAMTPIEE